MCQFSEKRREVKVKVIFGESRKVRSERLEILVIRDTDLINPIRVVDSTKI